MNNSREQKNMIFEPDSGISISLKENWEWRYESYDGIRIRDGKLFIFPPDEGNTIIIAGSSKHNFTDVIDKLNKDFSHFNIESKSEEIEIGKFGFTTYEFTMIENTKKIHTKIYLLFHNGIVYRFMFSCRKDPKEHVRDFEVILATLKLIGHTSDS